jgi:hypothetical protein
MRLVPGMFTLLAASLLLLTAAGSSVALAREFARATPQAALTKEFNVAEHLVGEYSQAVVTGNVLPLLHREIYLLISRHPRN